MKKGLHPTDYRPVVFQDTSSKFSFLTRSTASTSETIKWEDGNEYPLVKVHVSSASHPFFTGEEKVLDIEGRVDKFKARAEAAKKAREAKASKSVKRGADSVKAKTVKDSEAKTPAETVEPEATAKAKKNA